jgi:hypothetical protein
MISDAGLLPSDASRTAAPPQTESGKCGHSRSRYERRNTTFVPIQQPLKQTLRVQCMLLLRAEPSREPRPSATYHRVALIVGAPAVCLL